MNARVIPDAPTTVPPVERPLPDADFLELRDVVTVDDGGADATRLDSLAVDLLLDHARRGLLDLRFTSHDLSPSTDPTVG